jgi:hypothetical protein
MEYIWSIAGWLMRIKPLWPCGSTQWPMRGGPNATFGSP